jgi:hypothetical protein
VQKWEYLFPKIVGHNKMLHEAENMLVSTSDGRWNREKMPTNPVSMVTQLGDEGWEMVQYTPGEAWARDDRGTFSHSYFTAVLKRPKSWTMPIEQEHLQTYREIFVHREDVFAPQPPGVPIFRSAPLSQTILSEFTCKVSELQAQRAYFHLQ